MLAQAASTIHLEAVPTPSTTPSPTSGMGDPRGGLAWRGARREHGSLGGGGNCENKGKGNQGDERRAGRLALEVDKVEEVREQDEEDRKDVDHADARLDEKHSIETSERGSSYGK